MRRTAGFEPAAKTISHRGERKEREEGENVNKEEKALLFGNVVIIAVIKNKQSYNIYHNYLLEIIRNLSFIVP